MEKTIHYGNSTDAQKDFIGAKIDQELGGCQSCLVEDAFKAEFFSIDDIVNLYPDKSDEIEELESEIAALEDTNLELHGAAEDAVQKKIDGLEDDKSELESEQDRPQEVYEWWPIESSFLADNLDNMGEAVLKNDYGDWWGRCCSGQAIKLDPTFWEIFQNALDHYK